MIKFKGQAFFALSQVLEYVRMGMAHLDDVGVKEIPPTMRDDIRDYLEAAVRHCEQAGLTLSAVYAKGLLERYDKPGMACKKLHSDVGVLIGRILDELLPPILLQIPADRADFYDKPALFGQLVADNFSDAAYDISEAGSCYATDRYTACVMHLMRALEVAIKAIGHGVGLPNAVEQARNSWTAALKAIGDAIGANDKANDPSWTAPKSTFFKDVRAQLFAVKVAWRDTSMHLEKKYDEKDAKRIYDAVKNFMEHLAEHLDQSGNFTP